MAQSECLFRAAASRLPGSAMCGAIEHPDRLFAAVCEWRAVRPGERSCTEPDCCSYANAVLLGGEVQKAYERCSGCFAGVQYQHVLLQLHRHWLLRIRVQRQRSCQPITVHQLPGAMRLRQLSAAVQ